MRNQYGRKVRRYIQWWREKLVFAWKLFAPFEGRDHFWGRFNLAWDHLRITQRMELDAKRRRHEIDREVVQNLLTAIFRGR